MCQLTKAQQLAKALEPEDKFYCPFCDTYVNATYIEIDEHSGAGFLRCDNCEENLEEY